MTPGELSLYKGTEQSFQLFWLYAEPLLEIAVLNDQEVLFIYLGDDDRPVALVSLQVQVAAQGELFQPFVNSVNYLCLVNHQDGLYDYS